MYMIIHIRICLGQADEVPGQAPRGGAPGHQDRAPPSAKSDTSKNIRYIHI